MLLKLVLTFTVNEGAFISFSAQTIVPFCDTNRSILAYIYTYKCTAVKAIKVKYLKYV